MDAVDLEWLVDVIEDERFVLAFIEPFQTMRDQSVKRLIAGKENDERERGRINGLEELSKRIEEIKEDARQARIEDEKNS